MHTAAYVTVYCFNLSRENGLIEEHPGVLSPGGRHPSAPGGVRGSRALWGGPDRPLKAQRRWGGSSPASSVCVTLSPTWFRFSGGPSGPGVLFIIQILFCHVAPLGPISTLFLNVLSYSNPGNSLSCLVFKIIHSDPKHVVLSSYNSQKGFFCLLSSKETKFIFWILQVCLFFDDLSKYMVIPIVRFRCFFF